MVFFSGSAMAFYFLFRRNFTAEHAEVNHSKDRLKKPISPGYLPLIQDFNNSLSIFGGHSGGL
jgi:hypothetical protein